MLQAVCKLESKNFQVNHIKNVADKDSRENLASSRFQDSQSALNFLGLWQHYSGLGLCIPWAPSRCPLLLGRTLVLGFRAHSYPV